MKVDLKSLKKNKGEKKKFEFLTPVKELLEKEYKEIIEEFTTENYSEALNEIFKKYSYKAFYKTPESLYFTYDNSGYIYGLKENKKVQASEDREKIKVKDEDIRIQLYGYSNKTEDVLVKNNRDWDSFSHTVTLEDLYIVTDEDKFEEYVLDQLVKEEEEEIKKRKEAEKKRRDNVSKEYTNIKKYGDAYSKGFRSDLIISFIEAVSASSPKEQFEKFDKLIDKLEEKFDY